jgi:galactokinase
MCELAGLSEDAFKQLYIQQPIRAEIFHLYRRAKHIYSEEKRVVQFRDTCEKFMGQQDVVAETLFSELGALMNASQASCHTLYDCSCDELEELTVLARRAGAYGSRLTGAGWGGASVSLVAEDKVPDFIECLKKDFYAKYHPNLTADELDCAVFASAPSSGAATFLGSMA